MKNDRLFQLLYLLLEKGTATAPQLAQALEVSVRTVYRDVETLSLAGVPVYASAGKGGGISLLPGFAVDKTLFSADEQRELLFALQSLRATDQRMDALLTKLGAAFQKQTQNWIEVDFSRWGCARTDRPRFELLKTAILEQRALRLTYHGAGGQTTQRTVHPIRLIFKDKNWYLQAFCLRADDYRLFKISRIDTLALTGEQFTQIYTDVPPLEPDAPGGPATALTLRFSPAVAFRVYDEFEPASVTPQPDGSLVVRVAFPIDAWVVNYLFSFGTQVEIVSPLFLREELARHADKIAQHYKT